MHIPRECFVLAAKHCVNASASGEAARITRQIRPAIFFHSEKVTNAKHGMQCLWHIRLVGPSQQLKQIVQKLNIGLTGQRQTSVTICKCGHGFESGTSQGLRTGQNLGTCQSGTQTWDGKPPVHERGPAKHGPGPWTLFYGPGPWTGSMYPLFLLALKLLVIKDYESILLLWYNVNSSLLLKSLCLRRAENLQTKWGVTAMGSPYGVPILIWTVCSHGEHHKAKAIQKRIREQNK